MVRCKFTSIHWIVPWVYQENLCSKSVSVYESWTLWVPFRLLGWSALIQLALASITTISSFVVKGVQCRFRAEHWPSFLLCVTAHTLATGIQLNYSDLVLIAEDLTPIALVMWMRSLACASQTQVHGSAFVIKSRTKAAILKGNAILSSSKNRSS